MSSLIGQIEDGLLTRLVAAFTKPGDARPWLKVEAWPTRAEGYRLTGAGDVFVIYKGARYDSDDSSSSHYDAVMDFEITVRARTLREQSAAYEMVESARNAVCGQRLDGSSGVTLAVRDDFVDYAEGVFAYALVVAVPVFILQPVNDASGPWLQPGQDDVPVTQIDFNRGSST